MKEYKLPYNGDDNLPPNITIHDPVFDFTDDSFSEPCPYCEDGLIYDDSDVINEDKYLLCGFCHGKGEVPMNPEKINDLRWSKKNEPNDL